MNRSGSRSSDGSCMNLMDYIAAAPEMTLLGLICVVLIADLFVDEENRVVTFWISMLSLVITLMVLYATAPTRERDVQGSYVSDPLVADSEDGCGHVRCVAFLYARDYLRANDMHKGEFYLLGCSVCWA